jgi:hypothetical protein
MLHAPCSMHTSIRNQHSFVLCLQPQGLSVSKAAPPTSNGIAPCFFPPLTLHSDKGRLAKIQLPFYTVMISPDTSKDAATLQIEALRRMGPERRLQAAIDLCQSSRVLLLEGVRKRHPEYDARQAELAVIRLTLPPSLFLAAYPESEGILP